MEKETVHLSVTLIYSDELDALRDKAEILEDMYAQREAETEKWVTKWLHAEAKVAELHGTLERQRILNNNQYRRLTRIHNAFEDTSDYEPTRH